MVHNLYICGFCFFENALIANCGAHPNSTLLSYIPVVLLAEQGDSQHIGVLHTSVSIAFLLKHSV